MLSVVSTHPAVAAITFSLRSERSTVAFSERLLVDATRGTLNLTRLVPGEPFPIAPRQIKRGGAAGHVGPRNLDRFTHKGCVAPVALSRVSPPSDASPLFFPASRLPQAQSVTL